MKNLFVALLLVITSCGIGFAQAKPIGELRQMFDYEQSLPLDVKEVGVEDKGGVSVRDVSYASPKGGRVTAYLVVPAGKSSRVLSLCTADREAETLFWMKLCRLPKRARYHC